MEMTPGRAAEIAEKMLQLKPDSADVRIFAGDDGDYVARVFVDFPEQLEPLDIEALISQLATLKGLLEVEELEVVSFSPLKITISPRGTTA